MNFNFTEEQKLFAESVRKFALAHLEKDALTRAHTARFPFDVAKLMSQQGLMGITIPEADGGQGGSLMDAVIAIEQVAAVCPRSADVVQFGNFGPIRTFAEYGSEAQKKRWLPKMVTGEAIGSLGMTEPHAGSDLKAIRTKAVRDGDDYVISGQKVFISNGQLCDVIVLATKTDSSAGAKGVTLFLVDTALPGFRRGRNLHKLGLKAQDTSELFFDEVRVPASAMLGEEGKGFELMMTKLAQERLAQAIRSATVAETVIGWTVDYTSQRKAFGKTIADFQNTQFKLAELQTEAVVGRQFVDTCIAMFMRGELDAVDAAMAKMWLSNLHCKVVDECLQLFGGWGYMWEYPIARAYADARVVKIAGGSIEVMKHIIGRRLFAEARHVGERVSAIAGINPV